jgi:exodeoxyribonuclease VII large subunit
MPPQNPFEPVSEPHRQTEPPHSAAERRTVYTVSELTAKLKHLIETTFPFLWVRGEISNFRVPGSGHCYFTLKDESAQIAAVVFRGQARQLKFDPEDGMSIIGLGRLSVYEPRGSYQLILEYIEPAGIGALQVAFEQLKQRLSDEGLFDQRRKKALPFLPARISVITSPSGAVVHDIVTVITRRFPNIVIEVVPAKVQGAGAADDIVGALRLVNERARSDVVILARGGGSLEDLQAFNSEPVARAIFDSRLPVVSAVGHETDVTIADFVADLRAPTPSAAAELVVPEKSQLQRRCRELQQSLAFAVRKRVQDAGAKWSDLARRVLDPRRKIQEHWLRLDDLTGRCGRLTASNLGREKERFGYLLRRFDAASPLLRVHQYKLKLDQLIDNLSIYITINIKDKASRMRAAAAGLEALNPLAILQRGYSVVRALPGRAVVTSSGQVEIGQDLELQLAAGVLISNVRKKVSHGKENI